MRSVRLSNGQQKAAANQPLHLTAAALRFFFGFIVSPAAAAGERCRYPVLRTTLNRLRKGMEPK